MKNPIRIALLSLTAVFAMAAQGCGGPEGLWIAGTNGFTIETQMLGRVPGPTCAMGTGITRFDAASQSLRVTSCVSGSFVTRTFQLSATDMNALIDSVRQLRVRRDEACSGFDGLATRLTLTTDTPMTGMSTGPYSVGFVNCSVVQREDVVIADSMSTLNQTIQQISSRE